MKVNDYRKIAANDVQTLYEAVRKCEDKLILLDLGEVVLALTHIANHPRLNWHDIFDKARMKYTHGKWKSPVCVHLLLHKACDLCHGKTLQVMSEIQAIDDFIAMAAHNASVNQALENLE